MSSTDDTINNTLINEELSQLWNCLTMTINTKATKEALVKQQISGSRWWLLVNCHSAALAASLVKYRTTRQFVTENLLFIHLTKLPSFALGLVLRPSKKNFESFTRFERAEQNFWQAASQSQHYFSYVFCHIKVIPDHLSALISCAHQTRVQIKDYFSPPTNLLT